MCVFYSNKQRGLDVISIHDIAVSMTVHRILFPIKRRWNVIAQHKVFCSQGNSQNDCPKQGDFHPSISWQLGLSNYNNFQPNNDGPKWQIPATRVFPILYLLLLSTNSTLFCNLALAFSLIFLVLYVLFHCVLWLSSEVICS